MRCADREIDGFLETPAWQQMAPRLAAGAVARLAAGTRIGPYEITGFIGSGGMGEVYEARDRRLDRPIAIKCLAGAWAADPERIRLFEQEARSAAALTHVNVVDVHDVGTYDGCPYLVTERLTGETLRARLDRGPLHLAEALNIARQLASGLSAVHTHGIVHGDIKPQNVFLTTDGTAKLLDFGLAHVTSAVLGTDVASSLARAEQIAAVRGTVGYIAPEQLGGGAVDHRADLFSFGCVLYEMVTGTRLFRGDTAGDTLGAIARAEPVACSYRDRYVPADVRDLIRHCLEKDPEVRLASADELVRTLRDLSVMPDRARGLRGGGAALALLALSVVAATPASRSRGVIDEAYLHARNPHAYEEYVRGMALTHALRVGPDHLDAARAHYERSLELEPGYPLALVGLADLEMTYFVRGFDARPARIDRAETLIDQALAAAPQLGQAYATRGGLLGWARRDFAKALTAYETAVRLDPSGRHWQGLAWALASLEPPRSIEAERAAREALRLDRDYEYAYFQLARALRQQRRYDEAIRALEDSVRMEPLFHAGYALLARIHVDRREWRRALDVLDHAPPNLDPGQPQPAERDVAAHSCQAYRSAAYAGLGELDMATAALTTALANGYRDWQFLDRAPAFDRLWGDARFEDLLKKYR